MKFDAHNGTGPKLPYLVFNANGEQIDKCIRGDTESGLIERYVTNDQGMYVIEGDHVKTVIERHPAPLVLKPLEKPGYPVTEIGQDVDLDAGIKDMLDEFHRSYPKFRP